MPPLKTQPHKNIFLLSLLNNMEKLSRHVSSHRRKRWKWWNLQDERSFEGTFPAVSEHKKAATNSHTCLLLCLFNNLLIKTSVRPTVEKKRRTRYDDRFRMRPSIWRMMKRWLLTGLLALPALLCEEAWSEQRKLPTEKLTPTVRLWRIDLAERNETVRRCCWLGLKSQL